MCCKKIGRKSFFEFFLKNTNVHQKGGGFAMHASRFQPKQLDVYGGKAKSSRGITTAVVMMTTKELAQFTHTILEFSGITMQFFDKVTGGNYIPALNSTHMT